MNHPHLVRCLRLLLALACSTPAVHAAVTTEPAMKWADESRLGRPFSKDPSVVKFGGRYLMYFSLPPYEPGSAPAAAPRGWSIGIAESRDLDHWRKVGELHPAQDCDRNGLCAPGAVVLDGKVHLFYQTYGNGAKDAICHAVAADGVAFERDPSNPVFRPHGSWTSGRAIDAEVFPAGGKLLMCYATRDPAMKVQMLGLAAADLRSGFGKDAWQQLGDGPVLRPELPWEKMCIEAPSVMKRGDRYWMFYAGGYNNEPQQIGVAVSRDGISWKRLADEPFLANGHAGEWNSSESGHPGVFVDEDGKTHLFFQGNNDRGRTWWLARVPVAWQGDRPQVDRAAVRANPKRMIVPTSQTPGVRWKATFTPPADGWSRPGFDDSAWATGEGGFGAGDAPNAKVRSHWQGREIWLRREFELPASGAPHPVLVTSYDESPEIYLNGVPAASLEGFTTRYRKVPVREEAAATLGPGINLLAVKARQTTGGQFIDVGLACDEEPLPVRRLLDHPLRDTSICLAPDGFYYLTGTTGHPTWWRTNDGIRVWRSADLTDWQPLGLVWSIERDATWQQPVKDGFRAVWAPEIHFLRGTFWIAYCMNWPGGGTGLLKSTSGKAQGPYVDVQPGGPITREIDAQLFEDDDGKVYWVYQNGKIARMTDDLSGLAEEPRLLKPANAKEVGFEGAMVAKIGGRYQLVCAEFNPGPGEDTYDCMIASADRLEGPYGDRYKALPHAGHNTLFKDKQGKWWATFFGNDDEAPWKERAGLIPIKLDGSGRVVPDPR